MFVFKSSNPISKVKFTVPDCAQFVGVIPTSDEFKFGVIVVDTSLNTVKEIASIESDVAILFCALRDFIVANIRSGFTNDSLVAYAESKGAVATYDNPE